jgi:hypothetical protein
VTVDLIEDFFPPLNLKFLLLAHNICFPMNRFAISLAEIVLKILYVGIATETDSIKVKGVLSEYHREIANLPASAMKLVATDRRFAPALCVD